MWGVHMSGLKNLAGARRLRSSSASNHGESGRSECTKSISVGVHHVDGDTFSGGRWLGRWWGTPVVCCKLRIEARVRRRDALESYWQEMGGRGARTGANRAGSRGGSRRPELRKETPSGLFQWLGGVLVECSGGVGTSWSSGPLFIGGSRGWP